MTIFLSHIKPHFKLVFLANPVWIIVLWLLTSCAAIQPDFETRNISTNQAERLAVDSNFYASGNNKLRKNQFGLWELYVEGNSVERGIANGNLTKELLYYQESVFINQIKTLVPSEFKLNILRNFLGFYNRKLSGYVPLEYKKEIYGLTRYSSDEFNFVAEPYARTMYFHGAHDIGHALQDLALVGCTSFAAWDENSADGKLILGRNFDFYAGDDFAKEKIVAFVNPEEGYKHAFVTWAGMIGVVSGMNEKGLTVTINAGKSSVPWKAKTPVSLVTKEILQYAKNIEEAIEIAKIKSVFVSESIMVGSAEDKEAILIEISPKKFGVYRVENNKNRLTCSNHFQSGAYQSDKRNRDAVKNSHSLYRFEKMDEMIVKNQPVTPEIAAGFLRNTQGLGNKEIGFGNEKAINQLMAHHSVIFQPEDLIMYVSTSPYQLGKFIAYDLRSVFYEFPHLIDNKEIANIQLTIKEDPFLYSEEYLNYEKFRYEYKIVQQKINDKNKLDENEIENFLSLNPNYYKPYLLMGDYYFNRKEFTKAKELYNTALQKEITTLPEKIELEKKIGKCERKIK